MADQNEENFDEILQKIQRDINCLSDDNKTTRRRAIEKIKRETISCSFLHELLDKSLMKPLLKLFTDPVEKCRELAINYITECVTVITDPSHFLPLIIPVIVARLGTRDISEPSEEIRLLLVELLNSLLKLCGCGFNPYLHDTVTILRYTLLDPYPSVKKESCHCVIILSSLLPHLFHQESEIIVNSLIPSLTHQHSKIRIASLKALGSAIRYGTAKSLNDTLLQQLAQRACDSNNTVRLACVHVIGNWLLELPDRYSYHHKLIPLLLTCMNDEVTEIKENVHKLWTQIGIDYEKENENDLKDKLDFVTIKESFPKLEVSRPPLGCRVLVYRNFSKILPAIINDINDWTVHSRIQSCMLLYSLLYHLEESITQHIQTVLKGLYKACQDEESVVVKWACKCAQIIGYYVPTEIWSHLLLPAIRVSSGGAGASSVPVGPVQCTSCLMVLNNMMQGSQEEDTYLKDITLCLSSPELFQTSHSSLLQELLNCVTTIINMSCDISHVSLDLFITLLRLSYTSDVSSVMDLLGKRQELDSLSLLYTKHGHDIMAAIKDDYKNWSLFSSNFMLFSSFIKGGIGHSPPVMNDIITVISYYTNTEREPEMRLRFITLLIQCVLNGDNVQSSQYSDIINNIIIPSCVWRAGRTAAAIRTAALTGAQVILNTITHNELQMLMDKFLPQVLTCLDDDNYSTRLVACKVLDQLLSTAQFTVDSLHELYSHLFKRLDDSHDDIRHQTTLTLLTYFKSFPTNYDAQLYKGHTEVIYSTLLIHLDDTSTVIQTSIVNVLKIAHKLDTSLCLKMIENVKGKHRTDKYCNQVIEHIMTNPSHIL